MAQAAIGLIETRGLVGAVEAADAAAKAADVDLLGFEQVGGGLVSLRLQGDVASVQTAVRAGVEAARKLSPVISHHVIPAPHLDLAGLLQARNASADRAADKLEDLPVSRLRQLVRQLPDARIQGRQVSRANKESLLAELLRARQEEEP